LNTKFPSNLVGTTLTTGTGTFALESGATSFSASLDAHLIDGQAYAYFVRWPDNSTVGWEEGFGVYSATGNGSITRATIVNSYDGVGVAHSFAAGTKHIAIITSGSELANMARVFLSLDPWEDILVGCTGQSNAGTSVAYYASAPADTPASKVLDWSRAAPGTGAYGWRQVVKADVYTDHVTADIYTGTPRSSSGTTKGSVVHSFAATLADITGRLVRTITVWRGATEFINATYGWLYAPASSNIAKTFKDAVVSATTGLPNTKLHIYLFLQGEGDAANNGGTYINSDEYGYRLADHLDALEDSTKWDICTSNTLYVLFDIPERLRQAKASQDAGGKQWDGHAQAAGKFGHRAFVIPTHGLTTIYDNTHYVGESADELGQRAAYALLSPTRPPSNNLGTFRSERRLLWPSFPMTRLADGSGNPADGQWILNVARNVVKIHHTTGTGTISLRTAGLGNFQYGDIIRFSVPTTGTPYIDVTILGIPTDGTTYFSYPCSVNDVGTLGTVSCDMFPQNTGFHNGVDFVTSTPNYILSEKQTLANAETYYTSAVGNGLTAVASVEAANFHVMMANYKGDPLELACAVGIAPKIGL